MGGSTCLDERATTAYTEFAGWEGQLGYYDARKIAKMVPIKSKQELTTFQETE
jgi:hypothetical protein